MRPSNESPPLINKERKDNTHIYEEHNLRIFKSHSNVSNFWSAFIFVFNIWTLLITLFWASLHDLPNGVSTLFHVAIECALFFEIIVRMLLKIFLPEAHGTLNLLHMEKTDTWKDYVILFVGSFPILTIFTAIKDPNVISDKIILFSRLMLIKLLRSYEIKRTIDKVEGILFYKKFKALVFAKFFKNLMIIIFVVHVFTCAWVFVQMNLNNHAVIDSSSTLNPFDTDSSYFARNREVKDVVDKYIDSCLWAVSTLTACSFGDVTPRTLEEVLLSLVTLLAGVLMIAMIFSDFANLMYLLDADRAQAKDQLQEALKLCEIYGVPFRTRYKIQAFYARDSHAFSQTQYLQAVKEMPKSLHTDIVLSLNKEMISKINLFNFASPDLLISIARCFYPKVSMAGDFVVRVGDTAEEMFFIKQGEVEVLATDNKTRIAILREGAYFGEIGLLVTQQRTVSVKALTVCVFEVLNKADFDKLMEEHPEQKRLLLQVANQRMKICSPSDIQQESHFEPDFRLEIIGAFETAQKEKENIFSPKRNFFDKNNNSFWRGLKDKIIKRFCDYSCVDKDLDFRYLDRLVLLPTSKFYMLWTGILTLSVFFNLIIIPYEISFGSKHNGFHGFWRVIDVFVVIVHFIDIWVHMNTSIKKKGFYIPNKDYIIRRYFTEQFVLDLIAFLPIDYIMLGLNVPASYSYWIKLFRFVKLIRYVNVLQSIQGSSGNKNGSYFLGGLAVFFICLNHIAACIMHAIATYENSHSAGLTLLKKLALTSIVDQPLIDQPSFIQYINFIYWAFSVSSSGSYGGDISAVTSLEKFFEIITVLFFRVYFTFISAEVATIFTSAYVSFKSNLDKKTMYEKWMSHVKLSPELVGRVKKYNEHIFNKFKGLDENKILADLPSSTRVEIMECILSDLLEAVEIFPNDEVGLFANVMNDFELFEITQGEYIFRSGEIAEEIFFIIDGEVSITTEDGQRQLAVLKKNDFFGEMSVINGNAGIRRSNARAKTNLTLAIWHLANIKDVWKTFPSVKENMMKVAERRQMQNENRNQSVQGIASFTLTKDPEARNPHKKETKEDCDENNPGFGKFIKELDVSQDENQLNGSKMPLNSHSIKNISSPDIFSKLEAGSFTPVRHLSPFVNQGEPDQPANRTSFDSSNLHLKPNSKLLSAHELIPSLPQDKNPSEKTENQPFTFLPGEASDSEVKVSEIIQKVSQNSDYKEDEKNSQHHSTRKHDQPGAFLPKAWKLSIKAFNKFEKIFKEVRPLILNIILFFDVMFAPLNIALSVAHSGPIQNLELTFASILFLNFLFNLKGYLKQRKEFKKVFPASVALSTLGILKNDSYSKGQIHRIKSYQDENQKNHRISERHDNEHKEDHKHEHKHDHDHEHEITLKVLFCDILFMIPFTIIFHAFHVHGASDNVFLIALQLVKLLAVEHLTWIFQREAFKKRYALNNILVILYAFIILNHIVACLFIIMANTKEDFNLTWYAKVPAPQFNYPNNIRSELNADKFTIYIHATYWAYMTTSHIGIGDVTAVNSDEKIYSSVVIMISTFVYAFLFGNLASLVDDLTPKFQKEFETNYRNVLEYIKNSKLDIFLDKIHKYYNYIWQDNKGLDENEILKPLPSSLRCDIFYARYEEVIKKSNFFQDQHGKFLNDVFYSFCKKYKCGVFMENDSIVTDGQEINDVYLILEGEAEVVKYDLTGKSTTLTPGDHLGGIIPNVMQMQSIKATKITKVAIIPQDAFAQLREAFPEWYANIMKYDPIYQSLIKYAKNIKLRLADKRQGKLDQKEKGSKSALNRMRSKEIKEIGNESSRGVNNDLNKTDQSHLAVPLYQNENPENLYGSLKLRNIPRSRNSSQNLTSDRGHNENEVTGKPQIKTFLVPVPNEDTSLVHSHQNLPSVLQHNNELPPGDKEPLEEKFLEISKKTNILPPLDFPQAHGDQETLSKGHYDSLTPTGLNKEKTLSEHHSFQANNPTPFASPTANENSKFLPDRASIFKRDTHQRNHENIEPPSNEIEVKPQKKGFVAKLIGFFKGKPKKEEIVPESMVSSSHFQRKSLGDSIIGHNPTLTHKLTLMKGQSLQPGSGHSQVHVPSFLIQDEYDEQRNSNLEVRGDDNLPEGDLRGRKQKRLSLRKANTIAKKGMGFAPKLAELIHEKKKMNEQLKSLKYYINPNSVWKTIYELVHTFVIMYSAFALPIYVGFDIPLGWGFILSEVFILIELIMYPIFLVRTAQYFYGILKLQTKQVWQKFVEKGFITYLIAALPFNLIFTIIDPNIPLWLEGILRLNRVLLIGKVSGQFALFSSKYPQITRTLNVIKPTFYLVFVSHFISCLFSWSLLIEPKNDFAYNFNGVLQLQSASFSIRYMISLNFILSIVTTTGYPELIIYNDYERLVCVILVYIGDALFALILGWYASNSSTLPEKYNYVFDRIRKMDYVLSDNRIPPKIRRKIENYFAYIVETRNKNKSCLEFLSGLLPSTTLREMASEQAKTFQRFSLLREFKGNKILINEIIRNLKQCTFLPHDYIITRGEYGSEMYCIAEGVVHMLSPNEKKIIAVLRTGAFFGELGLYTTTKRLTSFVAATFCLVYTLDKEVLKSIMKSFPHAEFEFKLFAQQRLNHNTSLNGAKKDKLYRAYAYLQAAVNANHEIGSSQTSKLLKIFEIPRFHLKNEERTRRTARRQKTGIIKEKELQEKLEYNRQIDEKNNEDDDDNISMGSLIDDCVEEEEIQHRIIDTKKSSFRVKSKKRERRYSRLQFGREKSVSKSEGLTIKWGINLH